MTLVEQNAHKILGSPTAPSSSNAAASCTTAAAPRSWPIKSVWKSMSALPGTNGNGRKQHIGAAIDSLIEGDGN